LWPRTVGLGGMHRIDLTLERASVSKTMRLPCRPWRRADHRHGLRFESRCKSVAAVMLSPDGSPRAGSVTGSDNTAAAGRAKLKGAEPLPQVFGRVQLTARMKELQGAAMTREVRRTYLVLVGELWCSAPLFWLTDAFVIAPSSMKRPRSTRWSCRSAGRALFPAGVVVLVVAFAFVLARLMSKRLKIERALNSQQRF